MGHALIWIETLSMALLLMALATAVAAHWGRFGRRTMPTLLAVGLVAFGTTVSVWVCMLNELLNGHPVSNWQSVAAITWTLIVGIGSAVMLIRGLRRPAPDGVPRAQTWSRLHLLASFAAVAIVTTITFSNLDLAVQVQLAALRAEGGAKAMAILPPRLPNAENAALVYQEAFDLLAPPEPVPPPWRDKTNHWLEYDRSLFEPKDPELREFIRTQERGLALLRKAAAMPGCSFVRDYSKGFEMPLPELLKMREAVKLLAYDALIKAEDGDAHGALADVAAIYGVIGHINDPVLIAGVAAATSEKVAAQALEDVLALTSPTAADLAQVSLPDRGPHRRALRSGLTGEEAVGLSVFETLAYLTSDSPALQAFNVNDDRAAVWALMSPFYRLFLLSDDLASYRRAMAELQRIAGLPYADSRKGLEAFAAFFRGNHGGVGTRLLVPSINRCVDRVWEADARRALARAALALAAAKAKTGAYPDKLDALVPDFLSQVPRDPYTGRPVRLKRDGAGVVIYSIGPDLKDDGGRPAEPGKTGGDLVFRLR